MVARGTFLEWKFHQPPTERARTMKTELIQAAATITASILDAQVRSNLTNKSGPLAKDSVHKAFVYAYRQLESAIQELEETPQAAQQKG